MQVTETAAEGLKREYKVIVPATEVQQKMELRLNELGQRIKLPGFRPGKVPLPVLKQRYGRSIMGEVVEQTVSDSSTRVMNERGLRAAGQPHIEIVSSAEDGDLEYKMAIELIPDISPMNFSTIKLERLVVDVPDADVDSAIERTAMRLRKSNPSTEARPGKSGDVLVIDFVGRCDGVEFPGGAATGHHLELGSKAFLPGFETQLVGASVGDHRVLNIKFPADYPNKDLADKDAVFEVDVREIRELAPVEINDELAKSLGEESVASLRNSARKRIGEDYGVVTRSRLKRQLLDVLADGHQFEVPPGLVETEFSAIWRQIEADRQQGRLDPEDAGKSDDDLKKEYRDISVRRVKLGLLLSEVGRLNNIQLSNEEMSRAIINEARRYPGQERQVIEYYQKSPQAMLQLRAPLYEDKVVDFMLELATLSERHVTPEQLTKELSSAEPADEPAAGDGEKASGGKRAKKKTADSAGESAASS
ncbi:MAG: trigger factor [Dongiaceae bacterium]